MSNLPNEFRKIGVEPEGKPPKPTLFVVLMLGVLAVALVVLGNFYGVL